MSDVQEFATVVMSRKQVITEKPYHSEKTGKDYARVITPDGGSFLYPMDSLKVADNDPERVFFSRPVGTEIPVTFGVRNENVPDDAPNSEKFKNITKMVKVEDLKAMYEEARLQFAEENSQFVNMMVPLDWGKHFSGKDGTPYVAVSVLIPEENGKGNYWNFVLPEKQFLVSKKDNKMAYFGFPRMKKDAPEQMYEIEVRRQEKNTDGSYQTLTRKVSPFELKGYVEAAVERNRVRNMFVNMTISDKLAREFTSKDGSHLLYDVSVPMYESENDKPVFYHIVVPSERVRVDDEAGKVQLSLFKTGSDGNPYTFKGKHSEKNDDNTYSETVREFTSEQIAICFEKSEEIYRERNAANVSTLADETREDGFVEAPDNNVFDEQNEYPIVFGRGR